MFLNFFRRQQKASKEDILNFGLHLLMKSPFDFNIDIKECLLHKYPSVTEEQIFEYEKICKKATQIGHDIIYDVMVKRLKAFDPMTQKEHEEFYYQEMASKFHWVNEKNLKAIYNLAS
jgi:hypothetical protein